MANFIQTAAGRALDAASLQPGGAQVQITHLELFTTQKTPVDTDTRASLSAFTPQRIYRVTSDLDANFPAAYISHHSIAGAEILNISMHEARNSEVFNSGAVGAMANGTFDGSGNLTANGTLYGYISDPTDWIIVKTATGDVGFLGELAITAGASVTFPSITNYPIATVNNFGLAKASSDTQAANGEPVNRYVKPDQMKSYVSTNAGVPSGTSLPASPVVGDVFVVTQDVTGKPEGLYECVTAGVWRRVGPAVYSSLTDGVTIAWDAGQKPNATVTLGGNRSLLGVTNATEGADYILTIKQDGTGSRTLSWNSNYTFDASDVDNSLATGANEYTIFGFRYLGGAMRCIGKRKGL